MKAIYVANPDVRRRLIFGDRPDSEASGCDSNPRKAGPIIAWLYVPLAERSGKRPNDLACSAR